eukprot:NODE_5253_length_678_cov_40.268603_g5090_i0.p1 GENE.NODE_5253_length_678_cov_40.268603_g5090_i0~~NODE_5253_length_678_cov_40.268603_g5090_i0.p1  ORF type:complete len:188 (+),score=53.64 NODE_5253_length_678_cov_40.268603_g5090_i0:63-566(+)
MRLLLLSVCCLLCTANLWNFKSREDRKRETDDMLEVQQRKAARVEEKRKLKWECLGTECVFIKRGEKPLRMPGRRSQVNGLAVKKFVEQKWGIPVSDQILRFDSQKLKNKSTLDSYEIPMAGEIQLTLKSEMPKPTDTAPVQTPDSPPQSQQTETAAVPNGAAHEEL